jgi:hypothetical protein
VGALMQMATVTLWVNPVTTRIILTRQFGQSDKLIHVWTVWPPLPRLLDTPPLATMAGFLTFTALHVAAYRVVAPTRPGRSWMGRGLGLAVGVWTFQYAHFEFVGLQADIAVVEGLAIARWSPPVWSERRPS